MKLELKEIGGTAKRHWTLERGRRKLGRSDNCDWQLEDPSCFISKLHCTIERDRSGFLLRDESANGTRVDGRNVLEGETARLADGTRIELGDHTFSVSISGEPEHDMEDPDPNLRLSDEPVTISAILADVAPGGRTAGGILGGRDSGEWPPIRQHGTGPSSRNADIGWNGPPQPSAHGSLLPDDWNEDNNTDLGNQLEHGSATHLSVPVFTSQAAGKEEAPRQSQAQPESETGPADPVTLRTAAPPDPPVTAPTSSQPGVSADLARVDAILGELEAALDDLFGLLELPSENGASGNDDMFPGHEAGAALRLAAVLERQLRFNSAFQGLLSDLSQAIEPRIVEARIDAEPRKLPWRTDRSYWQAYRTNFHDGENDLGLRDLMKKMMLKRLMLAEDKPADSSGKANEDE
jgi:type VI secretion system protein ImpI